MESIHQYELSSHKNHQRATSGFHTDGSAGPFLGGTFGGQSHFRSGSTFVKERLLDVENRIKQKFNHVTKLESSLD
jgi:hypothetical protein